LTTQWSVEDEEEAARERRRRERDRQLQAQDKDGGCCSPERPEQEALLSLKPSEALELEEDEGFGDWSQKPEQRQQHLGAEGSSDRGEPPRANSPEGQQEDRQVGPLQCACENEDDNELNLAQVHLKESYLSQEEHGPKETVQDTSAVVEAEEADELIDQTESQNLSIKKSNSVKKSQAALPISKIDERLEQYTQAIETASRIPKLTRQASIELPSMAVASTKSRWETGEVQAQSTAKTPCKDIVAGDMSKKSLWEQKGGSKTSSTIKSTPSGKRYKFVATGHGKYEKVLVDEGSAH
ncbi:Lymphocyte-specific protein 1, partial [Tupaia chinensis]